MNLRLLSLGFLAGLGPILSLSAANRLAENSPFLPPTRVQAPVVTENPPLELRGIVGQGEERLFNIYNPASKQSAWVPLNQATGQNYQLRTYDERAQTVSLDHGGRPIVLKLAQSKISPLTEARPQSAPAPVGAVGGINIQPAVLPRPTTPDQQRALENVAAEVERRRQLRNQMTQPPAAGQK